MVTVTAIHFKHYKTFKKFSLTLSNFNILVGPNNAGKSTVLGALKILSEGIKKAKSRSAIPIRDLEGNLIYGYSIDTKNSPIAIENVFYNYDDTSPAIIRFTLSNQCTIQIFFAEIGVCSMNIESENFKIRSPKDFKKHIDLNVGFVPMLSPVEQYEPLYQIETARGALTTYKASRNFRNIWFHYYQDFEEFRNLVISTWPGMDVKRPEINYLQDNLILNMFCPENHLDRELFWAGYGFQVWCQMLTFIIKNKDATLFVIDEPDVYLHADLQRQLLGILKDLGPDIVIATHSTEIITEADLNDILIINKSYSSARRITNSTQIREIFTVLGSNLNPVITQIAKTKRVLFVEGKDYLVFSKIAKIFGFKELANRTDFAVVPVEGFNPIKLKAFKEGIEKTIGSNVLSAVIFDRDYRSEEEVTNELTELKKGNFYAHIHSFKELENIVLIPAAIRAAIDVKLKEYTKRTGKIRVFKENIDDLLLEISTGYKADVLGQLQSHQLNYEKTITTGQDQSYVMKKVIKEFDINWENLETRLKIVPGKDFISKLNKYLQEEYSISLTVSNILYSCNRSHISNEITELIKSLNNFRKTPVD